MIKWYSSEHWLKVISCSCYMIITVQHSIRVQQEHSWKFLIAPPTKTERKCQGMWVCWTFGSVCCVWNLRRDSQEMRSFLNADWDIWLVKVCVDVCTWEQEKFRINSKATCLWMTLKEAKQARHRVYDWTMRGELHNALVPAAMCVHYAMYSMNQGEGWGQ